jgi:putative Mn2+ efflux pump MntP
MHAIDIIVVAIALSIDAFAVSLAASAAGRLPTPGAGFRLAFHFGLFQFLMPVLGWAAGATLEPLIESFDHWLAFGLLAVVGLRMISAGRKLEQPTRSDDPSRGMTLLALSTAVSIDALAIGLSLAVLRVSIWTPTIIIGLVSAAASLTGILLGTTIHSRFGRMAEVVGGVVLILIGVRVVVTHLNAP